MTTQQLVLSLVLATMVFSVALELKVADFTRVAQSPRAVVCGLRLCGGRSQASARKWSGWRRACSLRWGGE